MHLELISHFSDGRTSQIKEKVKKAPVMKHTKESGHKKGVISSAERKTRKMELKKKLAEVEKRIAVIKDKSVDADPKKKDDNDTSGLVIVKENVHKTHEKEVKALEGNETEVEVVRRVSDMGVGESHTEDLISETGTKDMSGLSLIGSVVPPLSISNNDQYHGSSMTYSQNPGLTAQLTGNPYMWQYGNPQTIVDPIHMSTQQPHFDIPTQPFPYPQGAMMQQTMIPHPMFPHTVVPHTVVSHALLPQAMMPQPMMHHTVVHNQLHLHQNVQIINNYPKEVRNGSLSRPLIEVPLQGEQNDDSTLHGITTDRQPFDNDDAVISDSTFKPLTSSSPLINAPDDACNQEIVTVIGRSRVSDGIEEEEEIQQDLEQHPITGKNNIIISPGTRVSQVSEMSTIKDGCNKECKRPETVVGKSAVKGKICESVCMFFYGS